MCTLTVHDHDEPMPRTALLRAASGQVAVLCTLADRIDEEFLDASGTGLRVVANHAVGAHNIDVRACRSRGMRVTTTPHVLTEATAEHAWALLLAAARRLGEGERLVRSRQPWQWAPNFMLGAELAGGTLGILGLGRIGRAVARRAPGFRMRATYHNRRRLPTTEEAELGVEWRSLDGLMQTSDALIVSCPLTAETRNLLDGARLARLKPSAVLVAITGGVVDEEALAARLQRRQLFAAALDSYANEPAVHPDLLHQPAAVLTPHLGSATLATRTAMGRLAADNILAVLAGQPPLTPAPG